MIDIILNALLWLIMISACFYGLYACFAIYRVIFTEIHVNDNRENCRCCGKDLHDKGGCYVHYVGRGFCHKCSSELMRVK